jgi:threonine dehydrogenase-like Zn-dependent dehydrogenase
MAQMRALVRDDKGVRLAAVPIPECGAHDVLLRVAYAGICRTDLYVADGRLPTRGPTILGHELSGIVERAPRDARLTRGTAVTVIPSIACRDCSECSERTSDEPTDPPRCIRPRMLGLDRDGAFADFIAVPRDAVIPVPSALSLRRAAYVEPVAAALAVLRAPIPQNGRGLIYGDNRIAELTRRVLVAHGWDQVMSAPAGVRPTSHVDFVIETVATEDALRAMIALVRPRGLIVLKSRPCEPVPFDVRAAVAREITFAAVNYGSFREAVALLAEGKILVDDLFEEPLPLEDFEAAFRRARSGESKKLFFALSTPGA